MKWFEISENLIPKLRELQRNDLNHDIVKSEDAVIMFGGMGDPLYLTFDGRVIIDECFMEEKGPRSGISCRGGNGGCRRCQNKKLSRTAFNFAQSI
jgi:hypothetical protein